MQKVFDSSVKSSQIFEAVLYVENSSGNFSESFGYGGRDIDTPMLTASVGKLFTTACILILNEEGRLSLDDKLSLYFTDEQLKGLHVYNGHDYSFDLTISNLLFQTSGLTNSSRTLADEDINFSFEQRLQGIKNIKPDFPPDTGAAYYGNMNFILLGNIIEQAADMPLAGAYEQMIFLPLDMKNTWLAVTENDSIPYMYYGKEKIYRPNNIISAGAAGGFVSTAKDLMKFSKGFWEGKLFDKSIFNELAVYYKLKPYFGPINYGGGYMQISFKGIFSMLFGKGELKGHSGVTGSFAFYYPEKDLHLVGDFNQLKKPSAPYSVLFRLTRFK